MLGRPTRVEIEPARGPRPSRGRSADRRSKSLPVSPIVVGTPAAGFEVASVEVDPPVVSVRATPTTSPGSIAPTRSPISVAGASSQVARPSSWRCPRASAARRGHRPGHHPAPPDDATRTFEAGLVLAGCQPRACAYQLSTDRVAGHDRRLDADLDRLSATDAGPHGGRHRPRGRHPRRAGLGEPAPPA